MSELVHIVCPRCDSTNRVPLEKLSAGPKCGRCSSPLLSGDVLELTQSRFQQHLQKSEFPLLVDFWASWCGPCQMMAPIFSETAKTLATQCRFIKVNTETEQQLAASYGIRGIPTLILFKNGREIARQSGALDKTSLMGWLRQFLA